MDNNINSNNNNKITQLFYKVIHNKYLFNKIMKNIHTFEWIEYDNIKQININNRKKFKDIHSLRWIINNKQFQLLKCKLESLDEYIDADLKNESNPENWLNQLLENDRELAITIFKLLLSSTQVYNKDTIFKNLHLFNHQFIEIATSNGPINSLHVLPSTLEKSFKFSTLLQIKSLLNSFFNLNSKNNNNNNNNNTTNNNKSLKRNRDKYENNNINNHNYNQLINNYKYKIINKIFQITDDIFQRDKVLQLVLDNPQYYIPPPSSSSSSSSSYSSSSSKLPFKLKNLDIKIDIDKILFNLISIENQNKLIDLNYYQIPKQLNHLKNQIQEIIESNNNNNSDSSNNNNNYNRVIKLIALIKNKNIELNNQVLQITNVENLKLFLNNNKNNWKSINFSLPRFLEFEIIKYYLESIENNKEYSYIDSYIGERVNDSISTFFLYQDNKFHFCKLLESLSSWNSNLVKIWLELIKNTKTTTKILESNGDNNDSNNINSTIDIFNQIINNSNNNFKNSNDLNKDYGGNETKLEIKSIETIDFIVNNELVFKRIIDYGWYFTFSNFNLFQYALNKYSNFVSHPLLKNPILNIFCESKVIDHNNQSEIRIAEQLKYLLLSSNIYEWTKVIKRCISYGYVKTAYRFLDFTANSNTSSIFDNSLLESSKYLISLVKIFSFSISLASKDRIQLFLNNNFNPITQYPKLFYYIFKVSLHHQHLLSDTRDNIPIFDKNDNRFIRYVNNSKRSPNDIVEIIKLLLSHYSISSSGNVSNNQQQEYINIANQNDYFNSFYFQDYYEYHDLINKEIVLNKIVNYLFRLLIQSKPGSVSIKTISSVYQLINSSGIIKVQNSTLFSIYYLSIKSMKLIKFIAESPLITKVIEEYQKYQIHDPTYLICERNIQNKVTSMEEIYNVTIDINSTQFSFEYIFLQNHSLDTILTELVLKFINNHLRFGNSLINPKLITKANRIINYIFKYFADIKRLDLAVMIIGVLVYDKEYYSYFINHFKFDDCTISAILSSPNNQDLISIISQFPNLLNRVIQPFDKYRPIMKHYHQLIINNIIPINSRDLYKAIKYYPIIVSKIHQLIFNNNQEDQNNTNLESFSIQLYNQLLNQYPNNQSLKLSKSKVNHLIASNSILFLKQLIHNNIINNNNNNNNNQDENSNLLNYLFNQLLNDDNYKFIDWTQIINNNQIN